MSSARKGGSRGSENSSVNQNHKELDHGGLELQGCRRCGGLKSYRCEDRSWWMPGCSKRGRSEGREWGRYLRSIFMTYYECYYNYWQKTAWRLQPIRRRNSFPNTPRPACRAKIWRLEWAWWGQPSIWVLPITTCSTTAISISSRQSNSSSLSTKCSKISGFCCKWSSIGWQRSKQIYPFLSNNPNPIDRTNN